MFVSYIRSTQFFNHPNKFNQFSGLSSTIKSRTKPSHIQWNIGLSQTNYTGQHKDEFS